jgi:hypothetical protein
VENQFLQDFGSQRISASASAFQLERSTFRFLIDSELPVLGNGKDS